MYVDTLCCGGCMPSIHINQNIPEVIATMRSGGDVNGVQRYEQRPTGSPVRVKADPDLVSDVSLGSMTEIPIAQSVTPEAVGCVSIEDILPDVPSDDENCDGFNRSVANILIGMNMQQHLRLFKFADIGLDLFLTLTEEDLEVIGIQDANHRKDIAHGIANIRRKNTVSTSPRPSALLRDVSNTAMSVQDAIPLMCHTVKHINSLIVLLRNYRTRLDCGSVRNQLLDPQHCAALGVEILTKEALVQAEMLRVQLNALLLKLDPMRPEKSISRRSKSNKGKKSYKHKVAVGALFCSCLTLAFTVAVALRKR